MALASVVPAIVGFWLFVTIGRFVIAGAAGGAVSTLTTTVEPELILPAASVEVAV